MRGFVGALIIIGVIAWMWYRHTQSPYYVSAATTLTQSIDEG